MPFEPLMGTIMYMAGPFAPKNWAECNGQTLPVNQNPALFSLLGTAYGGDGVTNFGLPDLRGRAIIGVGGSYVLGSALGTESVALQVDQIPGHVHAVSVSDAAGSTSVPSGGAALGQSSGQDSDGNSFPVNLYNSVPDSMTPVASATVAAAGFGQPHENRQPFGVLIACIALQGYYPTRN